MKTLGIVGGIAPESTVDYYRQTIALYRAQRSDGGYPNILINSIDLKKMLDLIGAGKLPEVTEYLLAEVVKLAAAGANFGLFASNTPHLVFEEIRQRSPIPLVSIVEATCEAALALGLRKVGLLGTRFTMEEDFYKGILTDQYGLEVLIPSEAERAEVHRIIYDELCQGKILESSRASYKQIMAGLQARGAEGIILGCTEITLLVKPGDTPLPTFDTTLIHAETAVELALS